MPSLYGYDGMGSVRTLTNAAGTVTDATDYDAWGNELNTTGSTSNAFLYRGEQYDSDLNLYYLRARYLNPLSGRFISRDLDRGKLTDPKTLHKYLYAASDPVNRLDPSGRDSIITYAEELGESEESKAVLRATNLAVQDELVEECIVTRIVLYEALEMYQGLDFGPLYEEIRAYCLALVL